MHLTTCLRTVAVASVLLLFSACHKFGPDVCDCQPEDVTATTSVFSTGFNNPRGLTFGPDRLLYVAEGGVGGTNTSANCPQVVPPVGPYTGSDTGARISQVSKTGYRSDFVTHLPSSQTAATQGGLISGVADVAFIGETPYALLTGAGCSHGVPSLPNGVIKINSDRSWTMLADLSAFLMSNPVAHPEEDDFEPDGSWYSMINVGGDLFALEPNHGELDRINSSGNVSRVLDISASQGHIVPTALTFHKGDFYVGNLDVFPIVPGASNIYKITPRGGISIYAGGFNAVLGVCFDASGVMYVLENTTGNPFPTPGAGDIVRVARDGKRTTIVSGLNFPTAMRMGPDGKLYVSNWGFGGAPGQGEIIQVTLGCKNKPDWGK